MKQKTKIFLKMPIWKIRQLLALKLGRKIIKNNDRNRYPEQWRNDYVLRKAKKTAKDLGIELTVKGYENLLKAPAIIAPNHASGFDPALILLALENPSDDRQVMNTQAVFLAKKELKGNNIIKGFGTIMNTFYFDRENPREALSALDGIAEFAKEFKKMIIIFPEGTRSKDGQLGEFKSGAFRIAKKHFLPIIPVTINNSLGITNFDREKLDVEVIFHKPIKAQNALQMDNEAIANLVRKEILSSLKTPTVMRSVTEDKVSKNKKIKETKKKESKNNKEK